MPKTESAKKRLRQDAKKRLGNKAVMSRVRTESKKLRTAVDRKDTAEAGQQLGRVTKLLHKAAARGVIHKNKAARTQSQLQKSVNSAGDKE